MQLTVTKNGNTTSLTYAEGGRPLSDFATFTFKCGESVVTLASTDYVVKHNNAIVTGSYFTDVGSYTVTVEITNDNYELAENSFDFVIDRADLTLSGGIEGKEVTYGTAGYYNVGVSDLPSASFTNNGAAAAVSPTVKIYTKKDATTGKYSNPVDVIKDVVTAGAYYVVYSYTATEGSNYNDFTEERIVTIDPASVTITKPTYSETYFENEFTKDVYGKDANHPVTGVRGETVIGTWAYSDITFKGLESSYTVTFTPNGNNYIETQATVTVPLYTVAKIGSTAYGSIENAIKNAGTSTVTIIVSTMDAVDNKTIVIREGFTIPANVTLVLPYDANGNYNVYKESSSGILGIGGYFGSNEGSYSVENVAITNASCVTKVEVSENTEITVNGTLVVAGQISSNDGGHDRSGHTGGTYAELLLNQGSKIYVNGTMKVYGYVTESTESATDAIVGEVIVNENGILYQPLIIRDFVSGAYLQDIGTKINEHSMLPVNQFEFVNVQSGLTVKYGGTMKVSANLRIQSVSLTVGMDVKLIGTGGGPLFELTNPDSYITINYIPDTNTADLASRTLDDSVLDIHMYNGGKVNPLVLSKDVPIVGEFTISTANGFLPLSWIYDITLHSGDYVSNQGKIHLMSGCNFTVAEDATLDVDNIYVTDNAQSHINAGNGTYPTTKGDAKLTVDGKLMIKYLGGKVYSNCNGATVVIEEPNSSSTVNQVNGGGTIVGAHTNYPTFVPSDAASLLITNPTTVTYENGKWRIPLHVKFDSNGGTACDNVSVNLNSDGTAYIITLPSSTREGFVFDAWYIGDNKVENGLINLEYLTTNTITLVARWTADGYVIDFVDYVGSKDGTNLNNYAGLENMSVKYEKGGSANMPLTTGHWKTDTSKQYYFSHYELADGTKITSYSYFDDKTEGNYTVYAIWIEKHLVTINIDTTGLRASSCYVKVNNTQYKSSTSFYVVNGESININVHARGTQSGGLFGLGAYDHRATITVENSLGAVTSGNLTAVTEATGKKSSDITKDITITAASGGSTTITIKPIS